MEKRFVHELQFRLDEVEDRGFAEITIDELLRWYGRQRIGKGVWQDLSDRWDERDGEPLLVGENRNSYTLVWGEGLTVTPSAWLQPISSWAQAAD